MLVQKRDPHKTSEFFIPKPQFALSSRNMACLNIRLNYNENQVSSCNCKNMHPNFPVWSELFKPRRSIEEYKIRRTCVKEHSEMKKSRNDESDLPYLWYQSKEVFKGFKFIR